MMKAFSRTWLAAAIAAVLLVASPGAGLAQSAFYFWFNVVDEYGKAYTGENVNCSVFRANQHAAAVIHTTAALRLGGNSPLFSDNQGKLHFYSTSSDPVDVACYYANGGSGFINKMDRFSHKLIIPRSDGLKVSRFSVSSTAANYQQDSGIVIPQGGVIRDVLVQNMNPLALGTYHLSLGFLGNHAVATSNSLVNQLPLTSIAIGAQVAASPEWLRPGLVAGSGPGVIGSGTHRGAALADFHAAACSGACGGVATQTGITIYRENPYVVHVSSGLSISFSAQPGTGAGLRTHVYVIWSQYHSGINRLGVTN